MLPDAYPTTVSKKKEPFTSHPLPPARGFFFLSPHFFLPFALLFEPAALEFVDKTLDARDGDVELALLPVADLTLSRFLFCCMC